MNNKKNGFTLLELMVTLAVTAVLITSGVPAFGRFVQNNRETTAISTLVSALSLARSEAVKRNVDVGVCASNNRVSCTGTWDQGWLVYYINTSGNIQLLRTAGPLDRNLTLRAEDENGTTFSNLTFKANGLSDMNGLFTLCDARGARDSRAVAVSQSGGAQASNEAGYAIDGTTRLACP